MLSLAGGAPRKQTEQLGRDLHAGAVNEQHVQLFHDQALGQPSQLLPPVGIGLQEMSQHRFKVLPGSLAKVFTERLLREAPGAQMQTGQQSGADQMTCELMQISRTAGSEGEHGEPKKDRAGQLALPPVSRLTLLGQLLQGFGGEQLRQRLRLRLYPHGFVAAEVRHVQLGLIAPAPWAYRRCTFGWRCRRGYTHRGSSVARVGWYLPSTQKTLFASLGSTCQLTLS